MGNFSSHLPGMIENPVIQMRPAFIEKLMEMDRLDAKSVTSS